MFQNKNTYSLKVIDLGLVMKLDKELLSFQNSDPVLFTLLLD